MTVQTQQDPDRIIHQIEEQARNSLRTHWRAYVVEGVILTALGASAAVVPGLAGFAVDVFIGWTLFLTGLLGLVTRLAYPSVPDYWSGIVLSLIAAALGAIFALYPMQGILTLTMALTAFFIAHGIGMIVLAASVRLDTGRWIFLLLSALIDFALAALVISQWPEAANWILGIYVGINLIFAGLSLMMAALDARPKTPA